MEIEKIVRIMGIYAISLLIALSTSSLFMSSQSYVPILLILFVALTVSAASLKVGKVKESFFILLIISAYTLHLISIYHLLPVGWNQDQRLFIIKLLKDAGRINVLKEQVASYYAIYPIPWLIASSIDMITLLGSQASLLLLYLVVYACSTMFLWLILRLISSDDQRTYLPYLLAIILSTSVYYHRPFQDLLPSALGILSILITFYLLVIPKSLSPVLLLLSIPLFAAHGLSIYIMSTFLFALAVTYVLIGSKEKARRTINYGLIIFGGTWTFQVGSQIIDTLVREVPYRWGQTVNVFHILFARPEVSQSVAEQQLHYVYWFDKIITPVAYTYIVVLVFLSSLYFSFKLIRSRDVSIAPLLTTGYLCLLAYGVAFIFSYKGIENYVARYLYLYATPPSVIICTLFISELIKSKQKFALSLLIVTLAVGILSMTESLYTPYASILKAPDSEKFEKLYEIYYAPAAFNRNIVSDFSESIYKIWRAENVQIYALHRFVQDQHSIIYSNGIVVATYD